MSLASGSSGIEVEPEEEPIVETNLFLAYDCSRPRGVRDAGYLSDPVCITNAKVTETRDIQYQVLQIEKHRKVSGQTCEVTRTQVARYCGTYDHQTMLPQASYYELTMTTSVEQCRKWHHDKEFRDINHQAYALKNNAINVLSYEEVGHTEAEGGEVSCTGQDWKWNKKVLHRMVVEVQIKITLKDETFLLSDSEVVAYVQNRRLPCAANTNGCQTPEATYLWQAPDLDCDLAFVRLTLGKEATSSTGEKVFVSTDGSLIRLIRQEAVSLCGRIVHATNYPTIYLYETDKTKPFTRLVEAGEVSISTYVKNRDDYLYNHIVSALEEELQGILQSDCQHRAQRSKRDFWSQHRDPGLATWLVTGDIFATAAGDVVYQYHCQPVTVRAVNLGKCYQALPVVLQPLPATGQADGPRQWFMEPLTHRLTHQGVEIPCSRVFRPKYRNVQRGWMIAAPEILPAPAPLLPQDLIANREIFKNSPDWAKGGLYNEDTLEAYEQYQDFSRTILSLGATLANQAGQDWRNHPGGQLSPEQLFPELQDPTKWAQKMWSKTRSFLHAWGEGAAIVFSLFALFRILSGFGAWIYGVAVLKEVVGWSRGLIWTLCPNTFLLRQYRQYNRDETPDEKTAPPYDASWEDYKRARDPHSTLTIDPMTKTRRWICDEPEDPSQHQKGPKKMAPTPPMFKTTLPVRVP